MFYFDYIKTNKLKNYLVNVSKQACEYFRCTVLPMLENKEGLRKVINLYENGIGIPLFYEEIKLYLREAASIAREIKSNGGLPERLKVEKTTSSSYSLLDLYP